MLLHIIYCYDFNQGNIFSLDILVVLLLDGQKQPGVLARIASFLSVPSSADWFKIRSARSRQILGLAFISFCISFFKRNQFPRQRKEINTVGWVLLLK